MKVGEFMGIEIHYDQKRQRFVAEVEHRGKKISIAKPSQRGVEREIQKRLNIEKEGKKILRFDWRDRVGQIYTLIKVDKENYSRTIHYLDEYGKKRKMNRGTFFYFDQETHKQMKELDKERNEVIDKFEKRFEALQKKLKRVQ